MAAEAVRPALVATGFVLALALPFFVPRSAVDLLVFAGFYAIGGLGVAFLHGNCGMVTLAQSAFYGVGAYSTAFLSGQLGLPSAAGIVGGVGLSAAIAVMVGWPILRLGGYYLALATLALGMIGSVLFQELSWVTGGTLGIGGIPSISILGLELSTPHRFYFLVGAVVVACVWLQRNLVRSPSGIAMRAMRDSAEAASSLGIDIGQLKLNMFVMSAVLGSIAGSLFAHYVSFVSVHSFGIQQAITFLVVAIVGGVHTVWGPVLGGVFVTLVPAQLSRFGDIHSVLFGLALIATVIGMPEGIGGALQRLIRRTRSPVGRPPMVEPAHGLERRPMPKPVAGGDALSIDRISHAFQGLVALRDVELNVRAGTIAALIGPNGSGKTTLFNIVSGFLHPKHGRVLYCGREITQDPVDVRSRAGLVRTFQTPRVFERLSTFENLMAGAYKLAGSRTPEDLLRLPASSRKRSQMEALAESACHDFGLDQVAWAPAGSLPPGQKRMLELARACVGQPRLLLLDEPSAGLNSDEIAHLKKTLGRVAASGVTILLVSHDMSVVSVATSVNVLYYGTIIARGTMEEIQGNAQVREAYLGLP